MALGKGRIPQKNKVTRSKNNSNRIECSLFFLTWNEQMLIVGIEGKQRETEKNKLKKRMPHFNIALVGSGINEVIKIIAPLFVLMSESPSHHSVLCLAFSTNGSDVATQCIICRNLRNNRTVIESLKDFGNTWFHASKHVSISIHKSAWKGWVENDLT